MPADNDRTSAFNTVNPLAYLFKPILDRIATMENRIMSALTDAVARITASTKAEIAAVIAALNQPNPDVAAAVTQLNALSDSLDAETAALTPPAPPTT